MPSGLGPEPSQQAAKLFKILKLLMMVQIGLGIFQMLVSIWDGFMMLIGALILFLAIRNSNFCSCLFYVILTLMDMISSINFAGNIIFTDTGISGFSAFVLFFILMKLPFYVVSLFYTFLAYKELKGIL